MEAGRHHAGRHDAGAKRPDLYGAVCRDEDWKRIPVVMLSAVPISVREHAFATIGLTQGPLPAPAACLEKPCTPEALLEVVNRLVPEPTTA